MPRLNQQKLRDVGHLVFRNVFILINIIIFAVVGLLFYYGDTREAILLGFIIVINIVIGTVQDIHAWLTLERLDLLTALFSTRLGAGDKEEKVRPQEIQAGDRIKLKLGDQVPCDGTLEVSQGLELNEALITGESHSFTQSVGEGLFAGSIVTSGAGVMRATSSYAESRIAKMTAGIKRYSNTASPIQRSINLVVRYAGYILLVVIGLTIYRNLSLGASKLLIVNNIGALASILVPQGLVIATTLMFAYGAVHFYKRHVLLQEMNSTEKLGRIKNLCMDKTGTLTENSLTVEELHVPHTIEHSEAVRLAAAYVTRSGDSSETIHAIDKFLHMKFEGEVTDALPFSSWRKYGGIVVRNSPANTLVFAGAPEIFLASLVSEEEKAWVAEHLEKHATLGKRLLCFVRAESSADKLPELSEAKLRLVAIFILHNNLRPGIRSAIDFFQERGVHIRIISGDNTETVRSVATAAGIHHTDTAITGAEMESWSPEDFDKKAGEYTIFARVKPEQKEKIITAMKKTGFTAMVGDGANDALAIKKSDLGIAMFDGAPATRQLASVVLTNNSFAELPEGVKLADNIIQNIEIFTSIFFNQTLLGFLLFLIVSFLGFPYPFAPLNITVINYFSIGFPGILISYWAINPPKNIGESVAPAKDRPFLKRVVPYPFFSSILQAVALAGVFVLSLDYLANPQPNTPVVLAFMALGFTFFLFAPRVFAGVLHRRQRLELAGLALIELLVLYFGFKIKFLTDFFSVSKPPMIAVYQVALACALYALAQYALTKLFFSTQTKKYKEKYKA